MEPLYNTYLRQHRFYFVGKIPGSNFIQNYSKIRFGKERKLLKFKRYNKIEIPAHKGKK